MIKIVAKRYLQDGVFEQYLAVVKELVDYSRQEAGCIEYALYADHEQRAAVIMETWASQEALDQHLVYVRQAGYPDKLNSFADPKRPAQVEKFAYVY